ncbi:MAG: hypothetical protein ACPGLV_16680, partial [Bacteroidia bacterium]
REGSDEYNRLMAIYKKHCTDKDDDIDCDQLKRKIAATREGSDEYNRLMAIYKKHCAENTDEGKGKRVYRKEDSENTPDTKGSKRTKDRFNKE